jgi:hypothetical protein
MPVRERKFLRVQRDRDDDRLRRILQVDRRRREIRRQILGRGLYRFIGQRQVGGGVGLQIEDAGDRRLTLLHDRVDRLQIRCARKILLDRLHDAVAHFRDRRAVVLDRNANGGLTDVRKQFLDDRCGRENAREQHQCDQHEDQRRPLDEQPSQAHLVKLHLLTVADALLAVLQNARSRNDAGHDRVGGVRAGFGDLRSLERAVGLDRH